jgi:hypothetical protein
MKIKGSNVSPSILPIEDGFHVSYKGEFKRGETVSVRINASDYVGNEMNHTWSFSIRRGGWVPTPTPGLEEELFLSFILSNLTIFPEEVEAGQTVNISVNITNVGNLIGTYEVLLKINEIVEKRKNVTLAPGELQTLFFNITRNQTGRYNVSIDGLNRSFTVYEVLAPAPEIAPEVPTIPPPPPLRPLIVIPFLHRKLSQQNLI